MEVSGRVGEVPIGATVVALNGEDLGTVHVAYRHYFVVNDKADAEIDLEVPVHAVDTVAGDRVTLTVNREALTRIPREDQSAVHRMHEE